jgi:hypothetical protein
MEDILERIEKLLAVYKKEGFLEKSDVIQILDHVISDCPEDKVLIETIKAQVDRYWSKSNIELKECMDDVFAFYGIINKKDISKKMIVEKKGSFYVKTPVDLSKNDKIKKILNK